MRLGALVGLLAGFLVSSIPVFAQNDTANHPPPANGTYGYNSYVPDVSAGANYVDPIFGTTVQRVTSDHLTDDLYTRNMLWNADETLYLHRNQIIDIASGTVAYRGIPLGSFSFDRGFDPVNPSVLYYASGRSIHQIILGANGAFRDSTYFTAPAGASIRSVGGTLNWLDARGRFMVVRYGSEPSVYVYDRQNLQAGPLANPIDGTSYIDSGSYIGITPDGKYLVGFQSSRPLGGSFGLGQAVSWAIDASARSVGAANVFWSLAGDHASVLSASDGHDYLISYDAVTQFGLWRADVSNHANGLNEQQQQNLPNNKLLLSFVTWTDGGHIATAAAGALKDWTFIATEDASDTFSSGRANNNQEITPWHLYRQEIIGINAVTGEVRRLAHHRSRSVNSNYFYAPRVSVSWSGKYVGWASNYNTGNVDVYVTLFGARPSGSPVQSASVVNAASFAGFPTVSPGSLNTLFGANLPGLATFVAPGPALPSILAGVQVLVDEVPVPLLYVSSNQINFQFPTEASLSVSQVVVVTNGVRGAPVQVAVAPVMPGIFTTGIDAGGQGVILNQDSSLNSPSNPAAPGSVIQIFATGLGSTDPHISDGQPAPVVPLSTCVATPSVLVGGIVADVLYSGLAPGTVGTYQVNARVPASLPFGGSIPTQIVMGDSASNVVNISVQ